MAIFTFQCPKCGQMLEGDEENRTALCSCPYCQAEFVPGDVPDDGGTGEPDRSEMPKKRSGIGRMLLNFLLVVICLVCGWIIWRKIRINQETAAGNVALKEAEMQRDRAELERAAQLDREYKKQAERARIANEARLREEEKKGVKRVGSVSDE